MDPAVIGILAVVILLVLMFLGVQVAIALAMVGFFGMALLLDVSRAFTVAIQSFYNTASTYAYSVIPLFIIMGAFAADSGVVEKAYDFASKWLSSVRGGLYLVTVASCALFAAVTGSSVATSVAIGRAILPEMKRHGYDMKLSVGTVAACGTLGVLIPPSIAFVIYGVATEESIAKLLMAGILPGVLTSLVYMVGLYILVRIKPNLAPPTVQYTWKERFQSVPGLWGVALIFLIIIGGIYSGLFTPNEAGAVGAFASIILLAIYSKGQFFKKARKATLDTAVSNAMMFFIILGAQVFSLYLTRAGSTDVLVQFVTKSGFSPYMVLGLFIVVGLVLGMFLSATAVILILAPPAHSALTSMGFSGIWLGVIMVKLYELASLTPPVAVNVYVTKALVPEVSLESAFRGVTPLVIMDVITVIILIAFPQLCTWLPTLAFGK